MNKASCLSLLPNAVLIWNTVHMSASPSRSVPPAILSATKTLPASHRWPTPTPYRAEPTSSHQDAVPASRRNLSWPDQRRSRMPSSERVNWQPISQMSLVASMIDRRPERHRRPHPDADRSTRSATCPRRYHHRPGRARAWRATGVRRYLCRAAPALAERGSVRCTTAGVGPPGRAELAFAPGHHGGPRPRRRAPQGHHRPHHGHERSRTRLPGPSWNLTARPLVTRPSTLRAIRYHALLRGWALYGDGTTTA